MIFDKFYRGRQFRGQSTEHRIPGTGMGLAISNAVVAANRGTIIVTSQPGHGTVSRLRFWLPPIGNPRESVRTSRSQVIDLRWNRPVDRCLIEGCRFGVPSNA